MARGPVKPPAAIVIAKGAAGAIGGLIAGWVGSRLVFFLLPRGVLGSGYAFVVWALAPAIVTFLTTSAAGEWAAPPGRQQASWIYRSDARRTANLMIVGGYVAIMVVVFLCWRFVWWGMDSDSYQVPASTARTMTFATGAVVGMLGSHKMAVMEQDA